MGHLLDILWSIPLAIASWLALHMIAKPILALRQQRLNALRVAERYAYFGPTDNEERISAVRREVFDAASALLVHARGGSQLIQWYCKALGYNLEQAALALNGIGSMAGNQYPERIRANNLSHVYISLAAGHHLSDEARQRHQEATKADKAKVSQDKS